MFFYNKEQLSTHVYLFRFLAAGHILKMLNAYVYLQMTVDGYYGSVIL